MGEEIKEEKVELGQAPEGYEEVHGTEYWKPETDGQSVEGKVIEVTDDEEYGMSWMIKTADGRKIKTPGHRVLQDRMKDVPLGATVFIQFIGTQKSTDPKKNDTKMYIVFVKKVTENQ